MEYMGGTDEIAYDVSNIGRNDGTHIESVDIPLMVKSVACKLKEQFDETREMESWHRIDSGSNNFKTSFKGGAEWNHIDYRATINISNPKEVIIERRADIDRRGEHRQLPWGRTNICTFLLTAKKPDCTASKTGPSATQHATFQFAT